MSLPPSATPQSQPSLSTHLVWAIAATVASVFLFCILGMVSGVVAIVYAALARRRFGAGDDTGAIEASRSAKVWCWITTVLLIVGLCVATLFVYSGGWAKYQQMMEELQRIHLHG
ncbi:CD225/dispanin family protein [Lysobacter sp. TAF61]|uniref:CD225/dispanin family protein n=1 Tax=Lysobacter sp. TAF61 TaxID=3233072 RepID=UPI003F9C661A